MSIRLWNLDTYPKSLLSLLSAEQCVAVKDNVEAKVQSILSGCTIAFYHATRIVSADDLISRGIRARDCDDYLNETTDCLKNAGLSNERLSAVREALLRSLLCREGNRRRAQIWLAANPFSDIGFYDYCEIIGGEIARGACNFNDDVKLLREIGVPVICETSIVFDALREEDKVLFTNAICSIAKDQTKCLSRNVSCSITSSCSVNRLMNIADLMEGQLTLEQKAMLIRACFDE